MSVTTIRCPECESGQLNTPRITVRLEKAQSTPLPFKVCRICKLIVPAKKSEFSKWRIWNGQEYRRLDE